MPGVTSTRRVGGLRIFLWIGLAWLPFSTPGQVNEEQYADYFLVGQFGEICTMCEVVILCEPGEMDRAAEAIPESGNFTLYHVQTRTFWSQVATIWEWFIANFDSDSLAQGHTRPVIVYSVDSGRWSHSKTLEARVALEPPLLTFGERAIDRTNRHWQIAESGEQVGICHRLPLWESLDVIAARGPAGALE